VSGAVDVAGGGLRKKTVADVDVRAKRVLVRVDFNVPLDPAGGVADDTRIVAALPTIRYLVERRARVVLASHLGRPKGEPDPKYSLAPVARRLGELLGTPVALAPDCAGPAAAAAVDGLKPGGVLLLENLRFHAEEEKNDRDFARELAALADLYVNDAFGTAHRAHASTTGVAAFLPAVAGFLMHKEIAALGRVLADPARPFVAVLGGAKVSDKLGVIKNLLRLADTLLLGGGMANTFLRARGLETGTSLVEAERVAEAAALLREAGRRLVLPVDVVVAETIAPGAAHRVVAAAEVPAGWAIADIGPRTQGVYAAAIANAGTVVWNGPLGVFEVPPFDAGTRAVAQSCAASPAMTVVGGGDSAAALEAAGLAARVTHLSTGGGASLEFLEGRELPGVAALLDRAAPEAG